MRLAILAAFLSAGAACAQVCTCANGSGCDQLFPGGNPDLQTYEADTCASFAVTNAASALLPQPKIGVIGPLFPAFGNALAGGESTFGPAIIPFMDDLSCKGVNPPVNCTEITEQFWNMLETAASCDASYNAFANAFSPAINIGCDCTGGGPLAKNATPPGGSGLHCKAEHDYDLMMAHAGATGVTLDPGFFPSGDVASACGLTPASATLQQIEACTLPFEQSVYTRFGGQAANKSIVAEEFTEGLLPWTVLSCGTPTCVAAARQLIVDSAAAIKAIQPSTKIGVAYTLTDYNYWVDAQTNTSLDFLSLDVVGYGCNPANNGEASYLATLVTDFVHTTTKPVYESQTQQPYWCEIGSSPSEANAYAGLLWIGWSAPYTGIQNLWQRTNMAWASANGLKAAAPSYCSVTFFSFTASQTNNYCFSGTASGNAMASLAPTDAAANWVVLCGQYCTTPPGPGPSVLPAVVASTTLTNAITGGTEQFELGTLSALLPAIVSGSFGLQSFGLLIDQEYMTFTPSYALGTPAVVRALRGAYAGFGVPHQAGATAYYGPVSQFQIQGPRYANCSAASVVPWLDANGGLIWDCTNGVWVMRAS